MLHRCSPLISNSWKGIQLASSWLVSKRCWSHSQTWYFVQYWGCISCHWVPKKLPDAAREDLVIFPITLSSKIIYFFQMTLVKQHMNFISLLKHLHLHPPWKGGEHRWRLGRRNWSRRAVELAELDAPHKKTSRCLHYLLGTGVAALASLLQWTLESLGLEES